MWLDCLPACLCLCLVADQTFELVHTVAAHSRAINSLVLANESSIWVASDDATLSVWSTEVR